MPKNIPALTGIRGYAALWVVLLHYVSAAGITQGPVAKVTEKGFAGVIVFLVLSGFVLAHNYGARFGEAVTAEGYWSYLYNRIARIYPLHLATLLAFAAMGAVGFPLITENETAYTFVLNLLLVHAWGFVNDFSWNALSWTISVEMFCYLWFPFLTMLLFRANRLFATVILLAAFLLFWSNAYYLGLYHLGFDLRVTKLEYGSFLVKFSAVFVSGAALYRLATGIAQRPSWISNALVILGLAVIAYACTLPTLIQWLMMIGGILIIAGLLRDAGLGRLLFGNPVSVFIGEISYSLYLTHFLVNVFLSKFGMSAVLPKLIIAIVGASASYYLFENPARRYLRSVRQRRAKALPAE